MTQSSNTLIRLETQLGAFVRNAEILPFLPGQGPDVIIWGTRCFMVVPTERGLYRECFCYGLSD